MKLAKQSKGSWQYELNLNEANYLKHLLTKFPIAEFFPVKISKTDEDPKAAERERLLNESLVEHRKELKKQARNLLGAGKIKQVEKGHLLVISLEEREILLQILNDIRIGSWLALGQPEYMEPETPNPSTQELAFFCLMNLAGYFEHHLIETECG